MPTHSRKKKRKTGISRLIEIAGSKKWWLIGSMILAVCAAIAQFIPYVAIYVIIGELAAHAADVQMVNKGLIWYWAWMSLGAVVVYGILLYGSLMLSHIAAFNILYEMRVAISRKLARLPLGYFTKRASGELKKIMSEDVERIELFVAHHIPDVATAIVFPLLMLGYLFHVDWRPALVILGLFLVAVSIQVFMMLLPSQKKQYEDYHAALGRMNASIVEYVRGIQVVKIFSRSMDSFERLQRDITSFRDLCVVMTQKFALVYTGFLTVVSSTIVVLLPVALLLLQKAPSYADYLPTVFLFLILGGGMFFPLLKLLYMSGFLNQNTLGVALIDDILDKPEIPEPAHSAMPKGADVKFDHVTFSYDREPVLENGYRTLVGEGGTYLSGGEQQRIGLARAILKNAPIVVLDEATAYADPENEGKILTAFSKLIKDKTVLVIAHRLSTVTNADQILVMERGTIVETGRHDELLAQNGLYTRMWQTYTQSREWVLAAPQINAETQQPSPEQIAEYNIEEHSL